MIGVWDDTVFGSLFGDPEIAALWATDTQIAKHRAFQTTYIRAREAAGLVNAEMADAAVTHIEATEICLEQLSASTAQDGVPIPGLVGQLKNTAGDCAAVIHQGATSQDVMDTSLALTLCGVSDAFETRLSDLLAQLDALSARFGYAPLMGRTRMQAALPVDVAHRISQWRAPLAMHKQRLAALRPRVEVLQLGGPVGDARDLGDQADAVRRHMANALGLGVPTAVWHTDRSSLVDYANLMSLITGTLGKLGRDICLMAQTGIDEVHLTVRGKSSAMAHKSNPVAAELLVTLAAFNATQLSAMHHALVHEQERSGSAWMLEWMVLPQMAAATGRALITARSLVEGISAMGTPEP